MSTQQNMFNKHEDCEKYRETIRGEFKYIEIQAGEKYLFKMFNTSSIVFLLKGKVRISCNEFVDVSIGENKMILFPMYSNCLLESVTETTIIILEGINDIPICDSNSLRKSMNKWLNESPVFNTLHIKPRLNQFLYSVKNYIEDGTACEYMHRAKQLELLTLLKAYYLSDELMMFFLPTVNDTHGFETFVMNNYLQIKGVKEFVDLSGLNIGTFKRKFKSHFQMSPYQWLIKQKSKHIYYELAMTDKSFTEIAKDFKFTDASHFNRYCKAMFGASPTEVRKRVKL